MRRSIPSEVGLNILELGGEFFPGVPDEELTERIKIYDPSFDYTRWKIQVAARRDTEKKVLTPQFNDLYSFIKENGNTIRFPHGENSIVIQGYETHKVIELISATGHTVRSRKSQMEGVFITVKDKEQFHMKLILLWLLKEDKRSHFYNYNHIIFLSLSEGMDRLKPRIDSLSVITDLPSYLRYAITRNRREKQIKKMPLYPLYQMLLPYGWSVNKKILTIYTLVGKLFIDEMRSIVRVETSSIFNYMNTVITTDRDLNSLLEIDLFYHPDTPYYFDNFK